MTALEYPFACTLESNTNAFLLVASLQASTAMLDTVAAEGRLHKSLDIAGGNLPDLCPGTYADDPRAIATLKADHRYSHRLRLSNHQCIQIARTGRYLPIELSVPSSLLPLRSIGRGASWCRLLSIGLQLHI